MHFLLRFVPSVLGCIALLFMQTGYAASSERCLSVSLRDRARGESSTGQIVRSAEFIEPRALIQSPGSYCLDADVVQRQLYEVIRGRVISHQGHEMVTISSDDVLLDLSGYAIKNEWFPKGIAMVRFYRPMGGYEAQGAGFERLTIRNGSFKSPGESGIGLDLQSNEYRKAFDDLRVKIPFGETPVSFFRNTGHIIENLRLEAGRTGIIIQGKNNVVRNTRIVIDADNAIISTGPNFVLENNVIEVRGVITAFAKVYGHTLPVQLIQADGAIVRNNRIRFIGSASDHRPEAAFDVIESRDVLFENNVIEAIPALERHDAASSLR